ncbi:MAG: class I SAM-dependent methyltransferase [Candidatus Woesebacteria bacterium]|jgi:ubiquinone/menaquinone biosynthesis C-methylase UbiE
MKYQDKKAFWESQYTEGETEGPAWYQALAKFTQDREEVSFELVKNLARLNTMNCIDLGCGEGNLVRWLSAKAKNVMGTDIAENRLKIAKKKSKGLKNTSYKLVDLDEKLKFKSNAFNLVTLIGVLEYTFDPYFVIAEINRVLKKGGFFVLEVPNLAFLPERLKLLTGKLPSWPDAVGWQGGRLHSFTFTKTIELLEENGFKVLQKTGAGFLRPLRAWWPELLCGDIILLAQKIKPIV